MNNNLALNRFFTKYILEDLIKNQTNETYIEIIERYVIDESGKSNGEIISQIYKYMSKNYRNEYFYQNTLLNKLLIGRHSLQTTTALTQIPVGKSKADFVMINGKAVVYEIKTELDSFERLPTQLADYYKAFNHVCVVTCESNYKKLVSLLNNTPVGICILTNKRNTLHFEKEPEEDNTHLTHKALFKILNKKEFETILLQYYSQLPKATQVFFYEACYRAFSCIPLNEAYLMVLKELKKRNQIIRKYFDLVPKELKSLIYFCNAKQNDYLQLNNFLEKKYIEG